MRGHPSWYPANVDHATTLEAHSSKASVRSETIHGNPETQKVPGCATLHVRRNRAPKHDENPSNRRPMTRNGPSNPPYRSKQSHSGPENQKFPGLATSRVRRNHAPQHDENPSYRQSTTRSGPTYPHVRSSATPGTSQVLEGGVLPVQGSHKLSRATSVPSPLCYRWYNS